MSNETEFKCGPVAFMPYEAEGGIGWLTNIFLCPSAAALKLQMLRGLLGLSEEEMTRLREALEAGAGCIEDHAPERWECPEATPVLRKLAEKLDALGVGTL